MSKRLGLGGGVPLSAGHDSLAFGVSDPIDGAVYALTMTGGIAVGPGEGRKVLFGRNRPEVHVCIGPDDQRVSRHQGMVAHHLNQWWVRNTGRRPVRLADSRLLFPDDDAIPLVTGYTPLFVPGSGGREHLLELYVTGPEVRRSGPRHGDATLPPRKWRLSQKEQLVLLVLGQRYLLHEVQPQPLSYRLAAEHLAELEPDAGWTAKQVEHIVVPVRQRLSKGGVRGLTRDEVGEPIGNTLNHNLIRELMNSTTLVPPDLELISHPDD